MKRKHTNPERHTMAVRKSDIDYPIADTNAKLRGIAWLRWFLVRHSNQ